MALPVSHTTYVPDQPLINQLEISCKIIDPSEAKDRRFALCSDSNVVRLKFKPLKMGEDLLDISAKKAVDPTDINARPVTLFSVKSQTNRDIDLDDIRSSDIDAVIAKIYSALK